MTLPRFLGLLVGSYLTIGLGFGTQEYWDLRHHEEHLDEINKPSWKEDVLITPEEFRSLRSLFFKIPIITWPIYFTPEFIDDGEGDWEKQSDLEHELSKASIWYVIWIMRKWDSTGADNLAFRDHLYKWADESHEDPHMRMIEDLQKDLREKNKEVYRQQK